MTILNDEDIEISRAIRQGFERDANPGNTVNGSSNPFQLLLQGQFDLLKVATVVRERLDGWRAHKAEQARKAAEAAAKADVDKQL
jgi:hypothetical protein